MEKPPGFPEYREDFKPEIRLEFLRHDRREPVTEEKPDEKSRLTPEGRKHASDMGRTKNSTPESGFAYGSPRERTQETALRQLLADEGWVTDETTLGDVNEEIRKQLPYGKKLSISEKLNFRKDADLRFTAVYDKHYSQTKDLVPFLYYESDGLVKELGDLDDYSFTRLAGNVAEFVKKYITILPRWEQIRKQNLQKYANTEEMQRFLGTHSTVSESFLLKVIEKVDGKEAAKKFIEDLPDKNGVDFSEGISIAIGSDGDAVKIRVSFHDKTWEIEPEVIDEIINEKETLNKFIIEKQKGEVPK